MNNVANSHLSELAIYALSSVLVVAIIVSAIAAIVGIRNDPTNTSNSLKEFFNGGNSLKILTVFAVLVTSAFLALAGQLSDGPIALLSSVSGYVLGTLRNSPAPDQGSAEKGQ